MPKILLVILFFSLISFNKVYSTENKILFKIESEIITSIDILKEANYLRVINENMNNLSRDEIFKIAKNSLIREKIKKIKLLNFVGETEVDEIYLDNAIKNIYSKKKINSKKEFKNYLNVRDIQYSYLINKLSINALWNKLIYEKFSSKVIIDEEEIKKNILKSNETIREFNLSEIVFDIDSKSNLDEKFDLIEKNILEIGFENTSAKFSMSASSNEGGKIGWISENSLNKKLLYEINKLKLNEHTKPIVIPGGFIIIKLNEIKTEKKQINLDNEIKRIVIFKTNEQLNIFSNIYLKKVMKDYKIEQL